MVPQVSRLHEGPTHLQTFFAGTLPTRVSSIPMVIFTCAAAELTPAGIGPVSAEGATFKTPQRGAETPTEQNAVPSGGDKAVAGAEAGAGAGAGPATDFNLQVDLVMDVVSHITQVGKDYFVSD